MSPSKCKLNINGHSFLRSGLCRASYARTLNWAVTILYLSLLVTDEILEVLQQQEEDRPVQQSRLDKAPIVRSMNYDAPFAIPVAGWVTYSSKHADMRMMGWSTLCMQKAHLVALAFYKLKESRSNEHVSYAPPAETVLPIWSLRGWKTRCFGKAYSSDCEGDGPPPQAPHFQDRFSLLNIRAKGKVKEHLGRTLTHLASAGAGIIGLTDRSGSST